MDLSRTYVLTEAQHEQLFVLVSDNIAMLGSAFAHRDDPHVLADMFHHRLTQTSYGILDILKAIDTEETPDA